MDSDLVTVMGLGLATALDLEMVLGSATAVDLAVEVAVEPLISTTVPGLVQEQPQF